MVARVTGRRRAHKHRAQTPAAASAPMADDEARVLVAALKDLVARLETAAAPELRRLRRRAETALDRAKAVVAEGAEQVQEEVRELGEPAEVSRRQWALLGVAAACAVVIGLWARRAVIGE